MEVLFTWKRFQSVDVSRGIDLFGSRWVPVESRSRANWLFPSIIVRNSGPRSGPLMDADICL
jgi:hypothetical protein